MKSGLRSVFWGGLFAWLGVITIPAAQLVSVDYTGTRSGSGGVAEAFAVSGDGRLAAFAGFGTNYTASDTNGLSDVFVRDCRGRSNIWDTTFSSAVVSGNQGSIPGQFTSDGRFFVFASRATNLVPNVIYPASSFYQIYVRDFLSNTTTLESIAFDGTTASEAAVALPGGMPSSVYLSSDGRFSAFASTSTNLLSVVDTNKGYDVFCRDRVQGVTELITLAPDGQALDRTTFEYVMSTNGRYFAFETQSKYVVASLTNTTGAAQVYWRDRQTGTNIAVALQLDGTLLGRGATLQAMSRDGRYVCFSSIGTNFVVNQNDRETSSDLFIRDMFAGETWLVTRATNGATTGGQVFGGQFSANGEWLIFSGAIADMVPGVQDANGANYDIFAHHLPTRTNAFVSLSHDGNTGADVYTSDNFARISASGRFVAFTTTAGNLVPGLANHVPRLLLRDLQAGRTLDPLRVPSFNTPSFNLARFEISEDERYLFFLASGSYDPLRVDTNQGIDLFRAPLFAPLLKAFVPGQSILADGLAGNTYVLEASSNLVHWAAVMTNVADSFGKVELTDPAAAGTPQRFYRLVGE